MKITKFEVLAFCTVLMMSFELEAKTVQNFGIWNEISIYGSFNFIAPELKNTRYYLSSRSSFMNDVTTFSENRVLIGVGYAVSKSWTILAGWGEEYETSPYADPDRTGYRLWQQAYWKEKYTHFTLGSRTRLEERFQNGIDAAHWRVRQLVEIIVPIPAISPQLGFVLSDEIFWYLNSVNNSDQYGLNGSNQNRLVCGLQYQFDEYIGVTLGYMNQYILEDNSEPNFMGNIIYTAFTFNFL